MRTRTRIAIAFASIIVVAVGVRAALPLVVRNYANEQLHALQGYDGSIEDVDLSLWRGAYQMHGLVILREGSSQQPFFTTETLNISIEWRSLLHGKLVSSADFERPVLRAIQAESEQETQLGKGVDWFERLKDFFPFKFNTIGVRNGTVFFRAPGIASRDAISAENVRGRIVNLTNAAGSEEDAFATFDFDAAVLGNAPLALDGKTNPVASAPAFDVNLTLDDVQLVALNPWLQAYAGIDAEAGTFELATEVAAKEGKFTGYAKPLMQDVRIHGKNEDSGKPLRQAWERIVDLVAKVFENPSKDQVATRIPLSGTLDDPDAGVLAAITGILKNAFVEAFAGSLENSVSLASLDKESREVIREKAPDQDEKKKEEGEGSQLPARRAGPRQGPT